MDLPFTTQGIVRCRDLVQATLGIRASTFPKSHHFGEPSVLVNILQPDPRRIAYEISLTETTGGGFIGVHLLLKGQDSQSEMQLVVIPPNSTILIQRDWRKDLDLVTWGVWCINDSTIFSDAAQSDVSVRETILSPNPVDEPVV